ncbi:hypothetical protein AWB77_03835 [Caballeronia fortuita]|uniref:Insertion element IS402-like domain-containing protein n=1 Tax=Caballeronia fortuita TaxID=1777138 RepID=A0A158C9T8_9BURK|nr:transposase [Caballeronia fortuita]SAK79052.1 hypothetical protein AWB77_03835 [Caballeronia fortuita]
MWLHSIERKNGRLEGKVIDNDGSVDWVEASSLWRVKMRESGKTQLRLTTNLDDWEVSDSAEYLALSGTYYCGPGDSHEIYVAHHLGLRVLIPALVVTKALFTPNAIFFNHLYRPASLDQVVAPVMHATGLSCVLIQLGLSRRVRVTPPKPALLQWMYFFPSARGAFASIRTNALRKAIGLELPKLLADGVLTGSLHGRVFVASSMCLHHLKPKEQAFSWAGKQPVEFTLRSTEGALERLNPILKNTNLIGGPNGWGLADTEWSQLKHIIRPYHIEASNDDRMIIDAILIKLATGMGWHNVNEMLGNAPKVSSFYQRLRHSGRWEEFEASLLRLRRGEEQTSLVPGQDAVLFAHNPRIRLRPRKRT